MSDSNQERSGSTIRLSCSRKQRLCLGLVASLALLLAGCSDPVTDLQGRKRPAVGQTARLIDKHGWLPTTESSLGELMTTPKINFLGVPPEQAARMMDAALERNAVRLKQQGKVMQVEQGIKVCILGYYVGEASNVRPLAPQEKTATWVKVRVLEGVASQKTGFTTADGVAE